MRYEIGVRVSMRKQIRSLCFKLRTKFDRRDDGVLEVSWEHQSLRSGYLTRQLPDQACRIKIDIDHERKY